MSLFSKRSTPSDCTNRIMEASNEVGLIRDLLDATAKGRDYKLDWEANRKEAHGHLAEASLCLGSAFLAVMKGQHIKRMDDRWLEAHDELLSLRAKMATTETATDDRLDETLNELRELRNEMKAFKSAATASLRAALARASQAEARATHAEAQLPQDSLEIVRRIRRAVMSALHPDRAADGAEIQWRTSVCQRLFPEIDAIVGKA